MFEEEYRAREGREVVLTVGFLLSFQSNDTICLNFFPSHLAAPGQILKGQGVGVLYLVASMFGFGGYENILMGYLHSGCLDYFSGSLSFFADEDSSIAVLKILSAQRSAPSLAPAGPCRLARLL